MNNIKSNFSSYLEKSYIDNSGKKRFRFVVSSNHVDRGGDSISISGIDLSEYERNPIVFYNHYWDVIIGDSIITKQNGKLYGDVYFDEVHEISRMTKQQVEAGTLKTASIGIEVTKISMRELTEQEQKSNKRGWIKSIRNIDECIMFEWSIVPLPANIHAEIEKGIEKGIMYPENVLKAANNELLNIKDDQTMEIVEKAGAKISLKNKQLLESAISNITKVLETETEEEKSYVEQIETLTLEKENLTKQITDLQTDYESLKIQTETKFINYEDFINNDGDNDNG